MVIAKIFYTLDRFFNRCAAWCWERAKKHDPQWAANATTERWKSDDPWYMVPETGQDQVSTNVIQSPERE